ncbi:conserved hypothetical protein [Vibrio coralliirubri]|nr:conserved hypothetical protein [Vibrio coralliirubri]
MACTYWSSVTVPVDVPVIVDWSSAPLMVAVTCFYVPSADVTVMTSVVCCPAESACTFGLVLSKVKVHKPASVIEKCPY